MFAATLAAALLLSPRHPDLPPRIGIWAYKIERQMEIWGADSERGPYRLLATYPIAAMSGGLGPKRVEGDMQAPEGYYCVNRFNPHSQYHLSLGLNYPNSCDRKRASAKRLGGDIFIHGNHVSAGCLAMTDPVIEMIYRMATHARDSGQKTIPVTILPCRLTTANWSVLCTQFRHRQDLVQFWSTLKPGYDYFKKTHCRPQPHADARGLYAWRHEGVE